MSIVNFQAATWEATLQQYFDKLIVLFFSAEWNDQSQLAKDHFAKNIPLFGQFKNVVYIFVCAEKHARVFKLLKVQYTPTVLFVNGLQTVLRRFQTEDTTIIFDALTMQSQNYRTSFEKQRRMIEPKINSIAGQSPVVIFFDGHIRSNINQNDIFEVLGSHNVQFTSYNVQGNERISKWVRYLSGYDSFPLLFVRGSCLGDTKTCLELAKNGTLLKKLPHPSMNIEEKMDHLIKKHSLLLFMEGFSFQNKSWESTLAKIKAKYKEEVYLFNVSNDKLKRAAVQKGGKDLPLLFVNGIAQDI